MRSNFINVNSQLKGPAVTGTTLVASAQTCMGRKEYYNLVVCVQYVYTLRILEVREMQ